MPTRVNPNYCVGCNKWEWDEELVKFGAYFYHKTCHEKLQAELAAAKPDKDIFKRLNKAFGKALQK
jgi:hypothetical protein